MARTLRFVQQPPLPTKPKRMNLGDLLYRLALVAPDQYEAIETLARGAYKRAWPAEDVDPLTLLELEGQNLLR